MFDRVFSALNSFTVPRVFVFMVGDVPVCVACVFSVYCCVASWVCFNMFFGVDLCFQLHIGTVYICCTGTAEWYCCVGTYVFVDGGGEEDS